MSEEISYFHREKPANHIEHRYQNLEVLSKSLYELGLLNTQSDSPVSWENALTALTKLPEDEYQAFCKTMRNFANVFYNITAYIYSHMTFGNFNKVKDAIENFIEEIDEEREKIKDSI